MATGTTMDRREALKALREQRAGILEGAQQRLKEQVRRRKEIRAALKDGPHTAPEVAAATGIPTAMVFWDLMAMKKYGLVVEVDEDGDYYRYQLQGE